MSPREAAFKHVLVEHARSRIGIADAAHAEYGDRGTPIVSLLECSINGSDITVELAEGSRLAALHDNVPSVIERTTCNYGLNPDLERIASEQGMRVAGMDDLDEVRAVERSDHPFFVATLYQPQLRSSPRAPHPVFMGFVEAAAVRARTGRT